MDFLLVIVELFSLGVTVEARLKIGVFAPTGSVWPKFQVEVVAPPPTILLLRKLG